METLAQMVSMHRAVGFVSNELIFTLYLGEGYWRDGEYTKAKQTLRELLDGAERCGMQFLVGSAHRLLGEVALHTDPAQAARGNNKRMPGPTIPPVERHANLPERQYMGVRIPVDREKIVAFCQRWKITELAFFGSVLCDDFRPESDVDVLVTFAPEAEWSLFDHVAIEEELCALLGRKVGLVSRRAIERSSNWIRRKAILETAEPYYAAR
jgi:uncharacterized protein